MAAASHPPDAIDEELLCCTLCLSSFSEPKILPCLHIFCKKCIIKHIEKTTNIKKPLPPKKPAHLCTKKTLRRKSLPHVKPRNKGNVQMLQNSDSSDEEESTHDTNQKSHRILKGNAVRDSGFHSSTSDDHETHGGLPGGYYEEFKRDFTPPPLPPLPSKDELDRSVPQEEVQNSVDSSSSQMTKSKSYPAHGFHYEDCDSDDLELDMPVPMEPPPPIPKCAAPVSPNGYVSMSEPQESALPQVYSTHLSPPGIDTATTTDGSYEVPIPSPQQSPRQRALSPGGKSAIYLYDEIENQGPPLPPLRKHKRNKSDWNLHKRKSKSTSKALSRSVENVNQDDECASQNSETMSSSSRTQSVEQLELDTPIPCYPYMEIDAGKMFSPSSSSMPHHEHGETLNHQSKPPRTKCTPPPQLPPMLKPLRGSNPHQKPQERSLHNPTTAATTPAQQAAGDITFACPACSQQFTLPPGELSTTLAAAYRTCGFISSLQQTAQHSTQQTCGNCEVKPAVHKCLDCRQYLCHGCKEAHHWLKISKGHRVMTLAQLTTTPVAMTTTSDMTTTTRCEYHNKHSARFFCAQCDRTICETCRTETHAKHSCAAIDMAAKRDRHFLTGLLDSIQYKRRMFEEEKEKMDVYEEKCLQDKSDVIDAITNQKEQVLQMVESVYSEMVRQINEKYDAELAHKAEMRRFNTGMLKTMTQTHQLTEQLLQHGKDGDVVTMTSAVKENFHRFQDVKPARLESTLQIEFQQSEVGEEQVLALLGKAVRRQLPCAPPPPANNPRHAYQQEKFHHSKETPVVLKEFRAKTDLDNKGCKPTGIALLPNDDIVIVDDINKKVKIFNQYGQLLKEFNPKGDDALVDPWDVAITNYGNFAVTDKGAGLVKILDPEGDVVSSFGEHLRQPWGIATNSMGDMVVTDPFCKSVFVHNTAGELKYSLSSKNDCQLFHCPEYVAVNNNDDIIVSDFEKHCVMIFDSFGRFLMKIGQKGRGNHEFHVPCGLACDMNGDIYIADYNNQRITQLDMNGRFRCYLLTMVDHLMMPQALAIDSKKRLVVIDGNHIKIFGDKDDPIRRTIISQIEEPKPKLEGRVHKNEPKVINLRRDGQVQKKSESPYMNRRQEASSSDVDENSENFKNEEKLRRAEKDLNRSFGSDGHHDTRYQDVKPLATLDKQDVEPQSTSANSLESLIPPPQCKPRTSIAGVLYDVPKPSELNYTNACAAVNCKTFTYSRSRSPLSDDKYEVLGAHTMSKSHSEPQFQAVSAQPNAHTEQPATQEPTPQPIYKEEEIKLPTKATKSSKGKLKTAASPKSPKEEQASKSFGREKSARKSLDAITRRLSRGGKGKKKVPRESEQPKRVRANSDSTTAKTSDIPQQTTQSFDNKHYGNVECEDDLITGTSNVDIILPPPYTPPRQQPQNPHTETTV